MSARDEGGPAAALVNADDRGGIVNELTSLSTFDAAIQLTRSNLSWSSAPGQPVTINYAYRSSTAAMPEDTQGFSRFTAQQIAATELALASWSDVANISFSRVTDAGGQYSNNAALLFANYASGIDGAAAFAYLPGSTNANASEGDVWVNSSLSYNASPTMFGYGQLTLVHEIGHAIGLSHPASYNAGDGQTFAYGTHAGYVEDSLQYTVMSYFGERETRADFRINRTGPESYASAPMMDDIVAAQRLYGVNLGTRTGDTVYGFNSNADRPWFAATAGGPLVFCVWDAGGVDTLDFSGFTQGGTIDLRQGAFSSVGGMVGNVSIVVGAVIENAIGSQHADYIRGNSGDNRLEGRGGADVVDGGLGVDTLVLAGTRASYTLQWMGSVGYLWDQHLQMSFTNVEFLQFSDQTIAAVSGSGMVVTGDLTDDAVTGTTMADTISGAGGDDVITGGSGDDTLDGDAGDDVLDGGDGDDTLYGGSGWDALDGGAGIDTAIFETGGQGIVVDLGLGTATQSGVTEQLRGFENVRATGGNDRLIGDGGANLLFGGDGVDRLEGRGGDDHLRAGNGGKTGGAPDILKGPTQANSSISAAVALTLFEVGVRHEIANSTTIPHATVRATGHGGFEYYAVSAAAGETLTFDIDGAAFDSTLRLFDSAGNELARNDDASSDAGRVGTDSGLSHTVATAGVYYVQVGEWAANVGTGFISTGVAPGQTYSLHVSSPRATPVPIVLTGSYLDGGAGADTLVGGLSGDRLIGGAGNDVIEGGGGSDVIDGGEGDDVISQTGSDTISGGAGSDTVVYTGDRAQYTLAFADGVVTVTGPTGIDRLTGVERLQFADALTDSTGLVLINEVSGTAGEDVLHGTAFADSIRGLDGDDVIDAGAGDDFIDGGAGMDTAVFLTSYSSDVLTTVDGVTTVGSRMGSDRLINVERLQFYNGTLIVGAGGGQYYGRGGENDWVGATEFDDQIESGGGDDILEGRGGKDIIRAGDGDDLITGGAGDDEIDGGSGHDVVNVSGAFSSYRLLMDGDDFILKGPDGGDLLTGVESIRFADGRVLELNRMYGPEADAAMWADGRIPEALLSGAAWAEDRPLVLPRADDEDRSASKEGGGPEILPAADGGENWFWKDNGEPLVLPGVDVEGLVGDKGFAGPEVLPALDDRGPGGPESFFRPDGSPAFDGRPMMELDRSVWFDRWSGQMPTVDEQGVIVDHFVRNGWISDGWAF
jgi:serralysin